MDDAGQPTGVLKERAIELITAAQQRLQSGDSAASEEVIQQKMRFLQEGMDVCVRAGLTTVHTNEMYSTAVRSDAHYKLNFCNVISRLTHALLTVVNLRVLRSLQANNQLPLRVFLTPVYDELARGADIQPFRPPIFQPYQDLTSLDAGSMESRLLMERVKIFSDGSLGAETAALRNFESSTDGKTSDKGVFVYEQPELAQMIAKAYRAGFRVEIHAIGDAAAEQVLNALDDCETILAQESQPALTFCGRTESARQLRHWRPILTHCQVLGADLIERMAAKGVVANVQPSFVPTGLLLRPQIYAWARYDSTLCSVDISLSDMAWVNDRIRGSQLDYSYVWKTLLLHASWHPEAGEANVLRVAGGSDAPIETPNPFTGIYDAMLRTNKRRLKEGQQETVFKPQECMSFDQALWIYTIGEGLPCITEHSFGHPAYMIFVVSVGPGGAYAAGVEDKLGQIAPGFIADLVLVDPAVLEDPEVLHGLLPDVVIVGGVISAVNRAGGEGDKALPVIEKCGQEMPYLLPLEGRRIPVPLSDATYAPGRGGKPRGSPALEVPVFCLPTGLKCACVLAGKYCASC
jgi:predicted amidohydrolase YtcJ